MNRLKHVIYIYDLIYFFILPRKNLKTLKIELFYCENNKDI
jgi:hypothetical protein